MNYRAWDGESYTYWKNPIDNHWTWERNTGLKDNQNNPIYEGDLVQFKVLTGPHQVEETKAIVKYDPLYAMFVFDDWCMVDRIMRHSLQVVGNIHTGEEGH
jgi:hypothetical protein